MFENLRKTNNMTQQQLATALSVSQTAISKWETGAAIPRFPTMLKISKLLGVEIKEVTDCFKKQSEED